MENNNYHQPIENPANQPIDRPIKVKKPSNQALTMVIVGLVAALLAGVIMYLVMNEQVQKEKSLASKNSADAVRVVELEKEVKELEDRGATTVTGINNESGYEKFKKNIVNQSHKPSHTSTLLPMMASLAPVTALGI